jgi:lipopolysaccharide transport system ATP-binding protein
MSDVAIGIQGLGKRYRLGQTQRATYLREAIVQTLAAPVRWIRSSRKAEDEQTLWALKDVSFEVKRGEVVGVIGRNGAGKSTLLKILSRITEPTEGQAHIYGRVGSLLEVGTGFHPELTGRENIFLNGAILGMKSGEVRRKFDEIVDFSDLERFIDTPVKRYSSGMYVRLAFAVAAHLEPEILVVDEVLAVGDAEFQRKCLGRMRYVSGTGRTVLFVSHNLAAVLALCDRVVVLDRGRRSFDGPTSEAVNHYLSTDRPADHWNIDFLQNRTGSQIANIASVHFENDAGERVGSIPMGDPISIVLRFDSDQEVDNLFFGIVVSDWMERRIFRLHTSETLGNGVKASRRGGKVRCRIPRLPLVPDDYTITVGIAHGTETVEHLPRVASFSVVEADVHGTGKIPRRDGGPCFVECEWTFSAE